MLVLTRRPGESIYFYLSGKKVEVKFNLVNGKQTRVGIDADIDVQVVREEKWLRLDK
jgi:carbon storage regulator CsrA